MNGMCCSRIKRRRIGEDNQGEDESGMIVNF